MGSAVFGTVRSLGLPQRRPEPRAFNRQLRTRHQPLRDVEQRLLASLTDFPIGVWLQSPHRAQAYQSIGINTYVVARPNIRAVRNAKTEWQARHM